MTSPELMSRLLISGPKMKRGKRKTEISGENQRRQDEEEGGGGEVVFTLTHTVTAGTSNPETDVQVQQPIIIF